MHIYILLTSNAVWKNAVFRENIKNKLFQYGTTNAQAD